MSFALTEIIHSASTPLLPDILLNRTATLQKLVEIIARERVAFPILVGPLGSGRTTCLHQLAAKLAEKTTPAKLGGLVLHRLDLSELELRSQGQFIEHLQLILLAHEQQSKPMILFFDEIETLIQRRPELWSSCLLAIMQASKRKYCRIGVICSPEIYYEKLTSMSTLHAHFEPVFMPTYAQEELVALMENTLQNHPDHKYFEYNGGFLAQLIKVSEQYIKSLSPPSSLFTMMDKVLSQAALQSKPRATLILSHYLNKVLAEWYPMMTPPVELKKPVFLVQLANKLQKKIFGQSAALQKMQNYLVEKAMGLGDTASPSLLFIGEPSIGKRTSAQVLHTLLYGEDIPPLILDMKLTDLTLLVRLLLRHLNHYPMTSIIFLNAEYATVEIFYFLQQLLCNHQIIDHCQRIHPLNPCLFIFIYQQHDQAHFTSHHTMSTMNPAEEEDSLLQLVVTDMPQMENNVLLRPVMSSIEASQPHVSNMPDSLLQHTPIIHFQNLSFSAKEKLVDMYLQQLARKIREKYNFLLIYSSPFTKSILSQFNLIHARAKEIHEKLDEILPPVISQTLIDVPPDTKNLHLHLSHGGEITCHAEAF